MAIMSLPNLMHFYPKAGVTRRGRVLFAARMIQADGGRDFNQPSLALTYMTPLLLKAGHAVAVSRALTFPENSVEADPVEFRLNMRVLFDDIVQISPRYTAFPVYDANVRNVLSMASNIVNRFPSMVLVFGAQFVTINPAIAREIFGKFPNVILINGEAEYALPQALEAYDKGEVQHLPGTFMRKAGKILSNDQFLTRVSLSSEEHALLEPMHELQTEVVEALSGVEITSSRGCFEGCSFCAASKVFRARHIRWDVEKQMVEVERAARWIRDKKQRGKITVGFIDDSFFYEPTRSVEFLRRFKDSPLSQWVRLRFQLSFASLFKPDESFREEIPANMLLDNGQPFVDTVFVGGDYWEQGERARNKGARGGTLSDGQIRQAVQAFASRKIPFHSYWMLCDEQTTMPSFVRGLRFLSELLLDFFPYFTVAMPELLDLYTGIPIRQRILEAQGLPANYLQVRDSFDTAAGRIDLYKPVNPPSKIIELIYWQSLMLQMNRDGNVNWSPDPFLVFVNSIVGKWREEVMNKNQRAVLAKYLLQRKAGRTRKDLISSNRDFARLPARFTFLSQEPINFGLEALLELAEVEESLPAYYKKGGDVNAERRRRHPNFAQQVDDLVAWLKGE